MNILETAAFGPNYMKIALMLRKSLLISSVLINCEVWYGLSKQDIKELEEIDLMFFRQLFRVPRTTPSVSFYLETGSLTFGMLIKMRRLKYLHYLINLPRPDAMTLRNIWMYRLESRKWYDSLYIETQVHSYTSAAWYWYRDTNSIYY